MDKKKTMIYAKFAVAALLLCGAGIFAFNNISTQKANAQDGATPAAASAPVTAAANLDNAWGIRCNDEESSKAENKRGKCEMFQRQDMKETGQRVIEFAIGYPPEQEAARGLFILPTGILLQEGVKMRIDENKPLEFQVRYCVPNGCMAYVSMNDQILDMMSKGTNAVVEVSQLDGKKIAIPMPLKGFKKSLDEIKS